MFALEDEEDRDELDAAAVQYDSSNSSVSNNSSHTSSYVRLSHEV